MILNLRAKLLLPLVITACVLTIYVYFVLYPHAVKNEKKDIYDNITVQLNALSDSMTTAVLENDLADVYAILDEVKRKTPEWKLIRFYNNDQILIYPLQEDENSDSIQEKYDQYESNVSYQGRTLGRLFLTADTHPYLEKNMVFMQELIVLNIALFVVFLVFISIGLDFIIRKPVTELAQAAGHLARENYNTVLPKASDDEIGVLISSFDNMRHSLRDSKLELVNQKKALDLHSMIYVADQDEHIIYVNDKWSEIGSYKKTDVLGRKMFDFINQTELCTYQNIMSVVNSGKIWSGQLANKKKNGSLVYTESTIVPFLNEHGKPYKYINIQTDISAQIYSELKAKEASERINHLLNYSSTLIYSRSLFYENGINYVSENVKEVLGYSQDDIIYDKEFWDIHIHPDDLVSYQKHFLTINDNELHQIEYRLRNIKNEYVWVIDRHRRVSDEAGNQIDIIGSLGDITDRINAENEMKQRVNQQAAVSSLGQYALKNNDINELFSKTVAYIKELLHLDLCLVLEYVKDKNEFIIRDIKGFENEIPPSLKIAADLTTHAGYTLEVNSEVLIEDIENDSRFNKPNFLTELGLAGGLTVPIPGHKCLYGVLCVYSIENRLFTYDDVQFIRSSANVLGLALERKSFEDKLVEYKNHLEDMVNEQTKDLVITRDAALVAERSMSIFLSNMSHELRTPLHGILSYARFGIKKYEIASKEKLHDYFTEIFDSGQTLLTLVSTLLDLSKFKAGKMIFDYSSDNIIRIVKSVIKEYSALSIEKNIKIDLQCEDDEVMGEVDVEKIMQVIRNLLSNAFKFAVEGSTVNVMIEQYENFVLINVIDNGVGIPANEVESIFKPFTQSSLTRTNAGGTGLGLSICKEIIESGHHGTIKANSTVGKGTCFTISVPLRREGVDMLSVNENR